MNVRPRRSVLYLPGSNPRALEKARTLPADTLILDLEDAVSPVSKDAARAQVVEALALGGFGQREVLVRVNSPSTSWGAADIAAVAQARPDGIVIPKVESAEEVHSVTAALDQAGAPAELPIWVTAETPRGILRIEDIAGASHRLAGIIMGTSDLAKDLRVRHTPDRSGFLTALSLCVIAARAHGLEVLDGVHLDLADDAGFEAACNQGRDLGFDGKTLIHPKQIEVANRVFGPSEAEIQEARTIIEAWEAARQEGKGITVVNGRLVENLHVEIAHRTLTLAAAIEALTP
ncbi:CoA ester lyase [Geomonas limicola]|uniref:CoA ester lyase n=1 Tax=Geomonas limicola TaxID=2740186 RepID=A0A6V8N3M3_9BACT|nr:CoA ester lyase [Geomonas limicola]GFO67051.1 CoA ester lyase [Geomonas limicola]